MQKVKAKEAKTGNSKTDVEYKLMFSKTIVFKGAEIEVKDPIEDIEKAYPTISDDELDNLIKKAEGGFVNNGATSHASAQEAEDDPSTYGETVPLDALGVSGQGEETAPFDDMDGIPF